MLASNRSDPVQNGIGTREEPTGNVVNPKRSKKRKRRIVFSEEEKPQFAPWVRPPERPTYASLEQTLHEEILSFMTYILPTPQERIARQKVFSAVSKVLKSSFPESEATLFGSATHDLCLPEGDLDICLHLQTGPNAGFKSVLRRISYTLRGTIFFDDVKTNRWAKVPVVSFKTIPNLGSFKVDISINNLDGVHAIGPVKDYLSKMPALRPLVMLVKTFLSQRKLNSAATAGLNSYAVICMAISFLQLNPLDRPSNFIEDPIGSESLGALLIDFFFYYGTLFPYATSYISLAEGKLLPKATAPWINTTIADRLVIQCLVQPNNNVAKAASRIEAVKTAFCDAYTTLRGIQLPITTTDSLKLVIMLSQATLNHREHLREVVYSGRLDAALGPLFYRDKLRKRPTANKSSCKRQGHTGHKQSPGPTSESFYSEPEAKRQRR